MFIIGYHKFLYNMEENTHISDMYLHSRLRVQNIPSLKTNLQSDACDTKIAVAQCLIKQRNFFIVHTWSYLIRITMTVLPVSWGVVGIGKIQQFSLERTLRDGNPLAAKQLYGPFSSSVLWVYPEGHWYDALSIMTSDDSSKFDNNWVSTHCSKLSPSQQSLDLVPETKIKLAPETNSFRVPPCTKYLVLVLYLMFVSSSQHTDQCHCSILLYCCHWRTPKFHLRAQPVAKSLKFMFSKYFVRNILWLASVWGCSKSYL